MTEFMYYRLEKELITELELTYTHATLDGNTIVKFSHPSIGGDVFNITFRGILDIKSGDNGDWLEHLFADKFVGAVSTNGDPGSIGIFDNFGVLDIVVDFGDHLIFIMTDFKRFTFQPIEFEEFVIVEKSSEFKRVRSEVTSCGFVFKVTDINEYTQNIHFNFKNPISDVMRIRVYESELYKNGSVNFDDFVNNIPGFYDTFLGYNLNSSEFSRKPLSDRKFGIYSDAYGMFSFMFKSTKTNLAADIFKSIMNRIAINFAFGETIRRDLEMKINRWFAWESLQNPNILTELIKLDGFITQLEKTLLDVNTLTYLDSPNHRR